MLKGKSSTKSRRCQPLLHERRTLPTILVHCQVVRKRNVAFRRSLKVEVLSTSPQRLPNGHSVPAVSEFSPNHLGRQSGIEENSKLRAPTRILPLVTIAKDQVSE